MPKRTQKNVLPVVAAAILGLGAGAAITHQWLMCPEYGYPKCYQQMVDDGFSKLEGVQYEIMQKWQNDSLVIDGKSTIQCPYTLQAQVYSFTETEDEAQKIWEGAALVTNGRFSIETEKLELPENTQSRLILRAKPLEEGQYIGDFDISEVLGKTVYHRTSSLPLLPK